MKVAILLAVLVLHCSLWPALAVVDRLSCLTAPEICFPTSDQTCVPCIGRWIPNHWPIRATPKEAILIIT